MAEVATSAPSPSKAAPKKTTKAAGKAKKEKAPANHPKYIEMAVAALNSLKERSGSSRQAIHKYIVSNYSVGTDSKVVGTHLKMALKRGVDSGLIKHVKGTGASGSFKANPEAKKVKKEKKPKVAKKAKASKPIKAKTDSPAKAAKSPAKAKPPAKAKSPKKAAAKPVKSIAKSTKSPNKKAATKASPAKATKQPKAAPAKKKQTGKMSKA